MDPEKIVRRVITRNSERVPQHEQDALDDLIGILWSATIKPSEYSTKKYRLANGDIPFDTAFISLLTAFSLESPKQRTSAEGSNVAVLAFLQTKLDLKGETPQKVLELLPRLVTNELE